MPIHSMTGFSRDEGAHEGYRWTWEVKSVNGRGLDVRFRLPPGHDSLEAEGRKAAAARMARGSVSLHLALRRPDQAGAFRINRDMVDTVLALAEELRSRTGGPPTSAENVLALPGVIEPVAPDEEDAAARKAREAAILESLEAALDGLVTAREDEGGRIHGVIGAQIDEIERLCTAAAGVAATQPEALHQRLCEQIAALLDGDSGLSEERLTQEAAFLATRADVREEIDRLGAHVTAARALLGEDGAIGRKLDFLCQEFNREANTLCSKSTDMELTRIGLDLKAVIDQLREQVQNVQ